MTCKDNKRKRHINECMRTSLANSGRAAGMGILYDRYDEESGKPIHGSKNAYPVYTTDWLSEKERAQLSGPVTIKRLEDCHDSKVCRALLRERQKADVTVEGGDKQTYGVV